MTEAKVVPTPVNLTEKELCGEVIEMVKHYPEGLRINDLENELDFKGLSFERVALRAVVWSLVAVGKLDISPNSIITIHQPEE